MEDFWVRAAVLVALLGAAVAFALVRRARAGRMHAVDGADGREPGFTAADLGGSLGERATLVQFSTPVCRDCKATARLLKGVADERPGVVHLEVDAEQRLDLARRFSVMRAPTVLVTDGTGRVVRRASGIPDRDVVLSALDSLAGSTR